VFNKNGCLLLHKKLKNNPVSEFYLTCLTGLVMNLYKNRELKNELENFSFEKFFFDKMKILILFKSGLVFTASCSSQTKSDIMKIYLLHMFVAIQNFMGELIVPLKYIKKDEYSTKLTNSESVKKLGLEIYQMKFFEVNFKSYIGLLLSGDKYALRTDP
jgi:hypothetical protein